MGHPAYKSINSGCFVLPQTVEKINRKEESGTRKKMAENKGFNKIKLWKRKEKIMKEEDFAKRNGDKSIRRKDRKKERIKEGYKK